MQTSQTNPKRFVTHSGEQAKTTYSCPTWYGRHIYFGDSYLLSAVILSIEGFMAYIGYNLMMAAYPITGFALAAVGAFFFCKKVIQVCFGINEMKLGIGQILGGVELINDLPALELKEGETILTANFQNLPCSIMRIEQKGETTHVLFNFNEHLTQKEGKKSITTSKTWIFSLSFFFFTESSATSGREIVNSKEEEILRPIEIVRKGFLTASEGHFLEHLYKHKVLLSNGTHSYTLNHL